MLLLLLLTHEVNNKYSLSVSTLPAIPITSSLLHITHTHCHLWPVWLFHIFPDCLMKSTITGKILLNKNYGFWFSMKLSIRHFSFWEVVSKILSQMYTVLHVMYLLFLTDFNETWNVSTDFWKLMKYQILRIFSIGSWVVPCRQADMMKLIFAFCKFANVHKKIFTFYIQPDGGPVGEKSGVSLHNKWSLFVSALLIN
jgi:hypothetical protein